MAPELRAAIDNLSMMDSTVYAAMKACRRQSLSEVDTLAHTVLHLATVKAALESELLKRVMQSPVTAKVIFTGHCSEGDRCLCGGDTQWVREGCGNWVKGGT